MQKTNPSGKPKTKATFTYRQDIYEDMSVTDPRFYLARNGTKYDNAFLVVSIGAPFNNKYYKFVAAVFII
jgi:hypothetical protein